MNDNSIIGIDMIKINCFCTDEPNSGNPAAIMMEFSGNDKAKQELAKQLDLPVTVFVNQYDLKYHFRFFYPDCEMPLCVHGALSAASVIMNKKRIDQIDVLANQRVLHFERTDKDVIYLSLHRGEVKPIILSNDFAKKMLNIVDGSIDSAFPFVVSSVGSPKLLIPLKNDVLLESLKPNYDLIKQWSIEQQINGFYVYVVDKHDKRKVHARGFNPRGGKNEDAATGVAAAALSQALNENFLQIHQGEFIGQASILFVKQNVAESGILVGGKVLM